MLYPIELGVRDWAGGRWVSPRARLSMKASSLSNVRHTTSPVQGLDVQLFYNFLLRQAAGLIREYRAGTPRCGTSISYGFGKDLP